LPLEARLLTGLAIAVAVVYWSTPLAIRLADRFEFYDKPAGYKGHAAPTPYLGGAALIGGFLAAVVLLAADWERTAPVVAGVVLLWVVGTIDDRRNVAWWLRVIVELGLATLLWATGLGWDLGLGGGVDLLLTAFWLVAVINAFNLFDNMDGQSATMGLVTSAGLTALGVANGNTWVAVVGVAMMGACFGFLPHNLLSQPARIFLGDGGSMPLGFAIAAAAMIGATDAATEWQAVALGLLLVGIPALDTTLVVVSRRRRGISVLTGGRDHLTHRARQRLRTAFAVAVALGSAQIVLSLMAVAASGGSTLVLGATAGIYLVGLGVAVALIDTRIPAVPPATPAPAAPTTQPARPTRLAWLPRETPLIVVLGAGAGISPLLEGYYSASVWGPIALVLLVCLLAVGIARPPQPGKAAWLALGGLAAFGLWALLSVLWADSIEQAVVDANRILALAAALGLAVLLIRDQRTALWAVGSFAAAAVAIELLVVVRLLGPDAAGQFLGSRLNEPLGYINAQATFSVLTLWPTMALAEQRRSAIVAGLGLAMTVVCSGLILLSQSRGAALAVTGSVLLVLLVAPGRQRRGAALIVAFLGLLAASSKLLAISDVPPVTDQRVHTGILVLLVAAAVCGIVWGAIVALEQRLGSRRPTIRRAATVAFAVAAAAVALVGVIKAGTIADELDSQYDAFVHLSVDQGGEQTASRLLSGAGNRYDYWRIAKSAWTDNPVLGVGAGNYDQTYFLQRSTAEDIRQPHSLVLQALSELGLPGLALVLLFVAGVAFGAWRHRARAREDRVERGLLVAGTGIFGAWLIHTQVDWIHLLPGITAAALIGAAVLLRPTAPTPAVQKRRFSRPLPRALVAAVVMVPVAVAGVSLSRQVLAQHYTGEAREAVSDHRPDAAIRNANNSLRLDAEDPGTYYAKAAAYAQLGDAGAAEAVLKDAVRIEPGDFVTYALLGDLSVRQRNWVEAKSYYGEALARNPRDPALIELAKDPRAAATP
jgi:UDP-GlcNAc:undecaprenyl-phosphate GlcNAc-1-phosphate transferase